MNIARNISLRHSLFFLLLGIFLMTALYAQAGPVKDPLGKPEVWKQLESSPKNDALWSKYFGKDLFDLTKEEGMNYRTWRTQLVSSIDSDAPAVRRPPTDSSEDAAFQMLTNNIGKNFLLIEDYFSVEFKKYGKEYIFFAKAHASDNYSKAQWVEEQEKKLKELKASKS